MKAYLVMSLTLLLVMAGCSNNTKFQTTTHSTGNPDVEEVFELYEDPDVLMWNDLVYIAGVDWVDELELTQGELVGEVVKQTDEVDAFVNGAANRLEVGSGIYKSLEKNFVLLVERDGEWVRYYALIEG